MFMTLTQIAEHYGISTSKAGNTLYALGIRDPNHPVKKGYPFAQYVQHGIAEAVSKRNGGIRYFRYDIEPVREEFEAHLRMENSASFASGLLARVTHIRELVSHDPANAQALEQLRKQLASLSNHIHLRVIAETMPLDEIGMEMLETLRRWRRREARKRAVPPYRIITNETLHALAYYQPSEHCELEAIKGFGETKLRDFGTAVLGITSKRSRRTGA